MKTNAPDADADPRYLALLQLLRSAETVWNASRVFFEHWDLSPSQFNVLNLLRMSGEGLSQTELGRKLIMHRSNVTGLVDRLERRGLVQRREVASDRRAYRVVVTEAGLQLLDRILPLYYDRAIRVWDDISAGRRAELTADLAQIAVRARELAVENETEGTGKQEIRGGA